MSARAVLIVTAVTASLAVGCGQSPSAVFVTSERTKGLMREAQKPVQTVLEESFGTPNSLVAWRKLPVDFGEFEGTVSGANEGDSVYAFQATLKPKSPNAAAEIRPEDVQRAALLWTSGEYKNPKYELKGKDAYVEFRVVAYDPASGRLTVTSAPPLNVAENKPPAAGDKFVIAGSVLRHGHKLFMTHCMHCHGVSGDGNGPTAHALNPRPRDYRKGVFKFTSTLSSDRASHADLGRIISQGIPGTYMPSFLLLKDDELHALVEYVRWLAVRGELEQKVDVEIEGVGYSEAAKKQRIADGESEDSIRQALEKYVKNDLPGVVDSAAAELAEIWSKADTEEAKIVPKKKRTPDDAASRIRGRALYLSAKAKCATCHGPLGHGDGPQTEDYQKKEGSNEEYATPGLFDDWGNNLKPRDLTRGIYRGGRRPIDIYCRIYAGIKGAKMPAFGGTVLNDDEIWDLVNYVLSIPYDGPLPIGADGTVTADAPATGSGEPRKVASVSDSGGN